MSASTWNETRRCGMGRKRQKRAVEYEDDLLLVRIAREMAMSALAKNKDLSRLQAAVDFLGDAMKSLTELQAAAVERERSEKRERP